MAPWNSAAFKNKSDQRKPASPRRTVRHCLGIAERVGTIAPRKQADLVLLSGDLAKDVTAIENRELVFKSGVGYGSNAIYESLRGKIGLQ